MSAAAVIDSLEFARAGGELRGSLPVSGLKRLEDVLFDTEGTLGYELRGGRDGRNRPELEVKIGGPLHLQCQRCLGPLQYDVDIANRLLIVAPGAPHDAELDDPEGPDMIEADVELEVAGLIEDEVLLSLPLAPRHPEGACASVLDSSRRTDGVPKAFAQLAALKDRR